MRSDAHQLTLDPLTADTWRLSDRAVAANDAGSVIAYVERRSGGRYAVTWVARGFGKSTYATLGDLLVDAAGLLGGASPRPAALKPVPIPHRPPLRAS